MSGTRLQIILYNPRVGGASQDRDGTGLGLYVGRALARANDGDLVLEGGATFVLGLPAERAEEG